MYYDYIDLNIFYYASQPINILIHYVYNVITYKRLNTNDYN